MKTRLFCAVLLLALGTNAMAQNAEYVNLRQYRVKDMDILTSFVKSFYPFANQSKTVPTAGRFIGIGESGRVYAAVYLTGMDQFSTFIKDRNKVLEEYSKTPGNVSQAMGANIESGMDDVLWHLEKDLSNIPADYDPTKITWRKLSFITVKPGMMDEYIATMKKAMELEKKAGISYTFLLGTVVYGAPTNTLMLSVPASSAVEYYTGLAGRQKMRESNPEITALRRKAASMTTNTLIDQVTTIPY